MDKLKLFEHGEISSAHWYAGPSTTKDEEQLDY